MPDELPHEDASIRDLIREQTYEIKELRKEMHQQNATVTALVRSRHAPSRDLRAAISASSARSTASSWAPP